MAYGGARPGAGRKPGGKNAETLEKDSILKSVKQRIYRLSGALVNAQANEAVGCAMLIRITEDPESKKRTKEVIKDEETITAFLAEELEDEKGVFYYITTEKPSSYAANALLDRGLGKAPQSVDVTSKGEQIGYGAEQITSVARRAISDG